MKSDSFLKKVLSSELQKALDQIIVRPITQIDNCGLADIDALIQDSMRTVRSAI